MTEDAADQDETPDKTEDVKSPTEDTTKGYVGGFTFVMILAIAAWALASFVAITEWSSYNDARDSFSISAPQVSQIADELMAAVMPFVVGATALTVLALLVGVRTIILFISQPGDRA